MSNKIAAANDQDFEQTVVQSDVPVLVDFWAPWCAPCRAVTPVLEEVAREYEGRARVVKVNVDESTEVAAKMGIRSIPTIALFQNGKVVDTLIGARPKDDFTEILNRALDGEPAAALN